MSARTQPLHPTGKRTGQIRRGPKSRTSSSFARCGLSFPPELLFVLAAMGHGDELAVVDANFPAVSLSRRLVRLSGVDVNKAMRAVLSVLPLDTIAEQLVIAMELDGALGRIRPVHLEVHAICEEIEERPITMGSLSRKAFYERVRDSFAVLATSEQRPYGCFLLTKGVLGA